jgi:hypothetical protein
VPSKQKNSGPSDTNPPAEEWVVIDKSELLQLIRTGIDTHFAALQNAFVQATSDLIISRFSEFSGSKFSMGNEPCKQLALLVLDPGINGAQGTRGKIEELLRSVPFEEFSKYPEFSELTKNRGLQADDLSCIYCHMKLDSQDVLTLTRDIEELNASYFHYHCEVSSKIREDSTDYRDIFIELKRKSGYVTKILDAFYTLPNVPEGHPDHYDSNPLEGPIENRGDFGSWLFHIYSTWSELSSISKLYHIVYWSQFLSLAHDVLEIWRTANPTEVMSKLIVKYLDLDRSITVLHFYAKNMDIKLTKVNTKKIITGAMSVLDSNLSQETYIIRVRRYGISERQRIRDHFVLGHTVIIDTVRMTDSDITKMMDFAAGLLYAQGGTVHQISGSLLVLVASSHHVTVER